MIHRVKSVLFRILTGVFIVVICRLPSSLHDAARSKPPSKTSLQLTRETSLLIISSPSNGSGAVVESVNGSPKQEKSSDLNRPPGGVASGARRMVIWSSDYHSGPINDLKHLLGPLGVRFIDKSLTGRCRHVDTARPCPTDRRDDGHRLKVVNHRNAVSLADPSLVRRFVEAYSADPEMLSVDAFVCFHPASLCELYEPFNRSLIVIASTRYELGRHSAERWTAWNANVVRYANDERRTGDFVGANNRYDAEYMRYFTGIAVVPHLPSFCGYAADGGAYAPSRPSFILAPMHNVRFAELFAKEFEIAWCRRRRPTTDLCAGAGAGELLFPLRRRYPRYNYSDLAAHRGIVHVPYQVSVMSLFEQYRMNIPLFFPSIDLLTKWQLQYLVMNERTWAGFYGKVPSRSVIAPHPSQRHLPDPNNERDAGAIRYWIQFSDFYQMPYITYFNSVDDLVERLETVTPAELAKISELMRSYNAVVKRQLTDRWMKLLQRIARRSPNAPH